MPISSLKLIQHVALCRSPYLALASLPPTFLDNTPIRSLKTLTTAVPSNLRPAHEDYIQSVDHDGFTKNNISEVSNASSTEGQRTFSEPSVHTPEGLGSRHNEERNFPRISLFRKVVTIPTLKYLLGTMSDGKFSVLPVSKKRSRYSQLQVQRPRVILARRLRATPLALPWREAIVRNDTQILYTQGAKQVALEKRPLILRLAPGTMARLWIKSSRHLQHRTWYSSIRRLVLFQPLDALFILRTILEDTTITPPAFQVADCIDLLSRKLLDGNLEPPTTTVNAVHRVTYRFLSIYNLCATETSLLQRTVYHLSRHSDDADFFLFWEILTEKSVSLYIHTQVHIMNRLIAMKKVEAALSMLYTVDQMYFSSKQIQRICVRILRRELDVEDLYGLRSKMLAEMLELGIRPNRRLHNVIILLAFEAGDWDTGWRCHQIALAYGLKPDSSTYAILLKSARDRLSVEDLRRSAISDGINVNTPRMATEFFIATWLCVNHGPDRWRFADLLSHYEEFFDVQSLIDLEILESHATGNSESTSLKVAPTSAALGIVVLAYLRENSKSHLLPRIYQNYCRLVRQGHAAISPLATETYIADAFIMAFGQKHKTFHLCTSVVEDMLSLGASQSQDNDQGDIQEKRMLHASTSKVSTVHPPSVRTWSVLMFSFLRRGQMNAAEKILAIMRSRGVWPNEVTWNTLISGYCHADDPDGAAWALRRMEEDGFARDERTMTVLVKISDKKRLMKALEKVQLERVRPDEDERKEIGKEG
ncbi:hypothetical protein MMC14_009942 [Varicellaria rhodocarpa]|nr:hypothetical protein [Varicellaria rhodocarpa]